MRIGTIYTSYGRRAGAELYFERTIESLSKLNNDIQFIIYCNKSASLLLENLELRNVKLKYYKMLDNQFTKAVWLEFLAKSSVERECDCFWISSGTNNFPGRWRPKTVITFLDLGEMRVSNKYDFKRMFFRKKICIPKAISRGVEFTSISKQTMADLQYYFKKTSTMIYPGFSPRKISNVENPIEVIFSECQIKLNEKILFVPGRTDYYGKGLDNLLDAYDRCIQKLQKVPQLILVGPQGEFHAKLIEEIHLRNLSEQVLYLGRVSDKCIDSLYQSAILTIIPSRFEGFGFPPLESMYHGTPVICSDAGSLPEVVGDAAKTYPSGNSDALYDAIKTMLCDNQMRQEFALKGKERVKFYTWEKSSSQLLKILKNYCS